MIYKIASQPAFGAPSASVFGGSNTQQPNAFGSNPSGGFGSTGMFAANPSGAQTSQQINNGTGNPVFQETPDKENASSAVMSKFQSISAMQAYLNWSFEELRCQDYLTNKKFASAAGGSGFGQTGQTTGSLFGMNKPATGSAFGASATPAAPAASGFFGSSGAAATQPAFGATAPVSSAFGAPAATNTSAFGSTGAFGAANKPATGFSFGGQSTGAIGAPPATSATSAFGSALGQPQQQQSAFGQPPQAIGGFGKPNAPLFGAPTNTQPSLFGQPAATQQPGATPAPLFGSGAAATGQTNFFGANKPLFGSAGASTTPAAPTFGALPTTTAMAAPNTFGSGGFLSQPQQTTQPGLFGSTPAPSTGLFGSTAAAPGTSLFGATTTASTLPTFGAPKFQTLGGPAVTTAAAPSLGLGSTNLFGAANTTNSLFGGGATAGASLFGAAQAPALNPLPGTVTPGGGLQAKIDRNPYGFNPLLQPSPPAASQTPVLFATPSDKKKPATPSSLKVTPRSAGKIKLRGVAPSGQPVGPSLTDRSRTTATPAKHSGVKPLQLSETSPRDPLTLGLDPRFTPRRNVKRLVIDDASDLAPPTVADSSLGASDSLRRGTVSFDPTLEEAAESSLAFSAVPLNDSRISSSNGSILRDLSDYAPSPAKSTSTSVGPRTPRQTSSPAPSFHSSPRQRQTDYIMDPPFQELLLLSDEELRSVSGFSVSLPSIGSVKFLEPVDLLDASPTGSRSGIHEIPGVVVILEPKLCTVYPDESVKPPVGFGVNVPAEINLLNCWPVDKATRQPITDESDPRHDRHMKKLENMPETKWLGFHNPTGTWRFRVEHFSRYGLLDDEEDEEAGVSGSQNIAPVNSSNNNPLNSASRLQERVRRVRILEPLQEDNESSNDNVMVETSEVQDSFLYLRDPTQSKQAVESLNNSRHALGFRAPEDDDDDNIEEEEGVFEEDFIDEEIADASFDEDSEHQTQSAPEDESERGGEISDASSSGVYASERPAVPKLASEIRPPISAIDASASRFKRMETARRVQSMKASLFRSSESFAATRSDAINTPSAPILPSINRSYNGDGFANQEKRARPIESGQSDAPVVSRSHFGRVFINVPAVEQSVPDIGQSIQKQQSPAPESVSSPKKYHRADKQMAEATMSDASVEDAPRVQLSKAYLKVLPPYEKSIACRKEPELVDASVFMGRSFRVGWGPNNQFLIVGQRSV